MRLQDARRATLPVLLRLLSDPVWGQAVPMVLSTLIDNRWGCALGAVLALRQQQAGVRNVLSSLKGKRWGVLGLRSTLLGSNRWGWPG